MKKILIVIPFIEIYPPRNGGKMRTMNLLDQLAQHFEVTAIIRQDKTSFSHCMDEYPAIRNCKILGPEDGKMPRDLFSLLPARIADALRYRWWRRNRKGPSDENFLRIYPILRQALKAGAYDHVILEEMGSLDLAPVIRRKLPKAHVIYDAYNVNTRLAAVELAAGALPEHHYQVIQRKESSLDHTVDAVFTCSEPDLAELTKMNKGRLAGTVVPNGVRVPELPQKDDTASRDRQILFCGSLDYFPNREGLSWFCREVLPILYKQLPSIRLLVVGRGDPGEDLKTLLRHPAILFYGEVEKVSDYYRQAAIAVVPLLSGSGTRLKLLEAMGYAVPVVSSTVGAEGIDYTDKQDILIADDPASFAAAIGQLLADPADARRLGQAGYTFARNKYDWRVVGERLSAYLNETPRP